MGAVVCSISHTVARGTEEPKRAFPESIDSGRVPARLTFPQNRSAAESASRRAGPFHDFYEGLLANGMKPELARVTLARKIAAITLTLWKEGERFDAGYVKPQAA